MKRLKRAQKMNSDSLLENNSPYRIKHILNMFRRNCHLSELCTFTLEREQVAKQIIQAFLDTTLEDGIGMYEADCIDDYVPPDSEEYQYWKALDERVHWEKVYALAHSIRLPKRFHPFSAISFMDNTGRRFAFPCYLLWTLEGSNHIDLSISMRDAFYMKDLPLDDVQKQAVLATFHFLSEEAFKMNYDFEYDDHKNTIDYLNSFWELT